MGTVIVRSLFCHSCVSGLIPAGPAARQLVRARGPGWACGPSICPTPPPPRYRTDAFGDQLVPPHRPHAIAYLRDEFVAGATNGEKMRRVAGVVLEASSKA